MNRITQISACIYGKICDSEWGSNLFNILLLLSELELEEPISFDF